MYKYKDPSFCHTMHDSIRTTQEIIGLSPEIEHALQGGQAVWIEFGKRSLTSAVEVPSPADVSVTRESGIFGDSPHPFRDSCDTMAFSDEYIDALREGKAACVTDRGFLSLAVEASSSTPARAHRTRESGVLGESPHPCRESYGSTIHLDPYLDDRFFQDAVDLSIESSGLGHGYNDSRSKVPDDTTYARGVPSLSELGIQGAQKSGEPCTASFVEPIEPSADPLVMQVRHISMEKVERRSEMLEPANMSPSCFSVSDHGSSTSSQGFASWKRRTYEVYDWALNTLRKLLVCTTISFLFNLLKSQKRI
ncbi:hypothetical protein BDV59DRAFT_178170 [Aspergillus ambiguus]|uniref:uncharacterized protein n=1 Tax=Aspergillus ambiguus TaxID=176160 RepID=UPI003CCE2117